MSNSVLEGLRLRKLAVKDAGLLRDAGIFSGTKASVEDAVRTILGKGSYYLLADEDRALAVAGIKKNGNGVSAYLDIVAAGNDREAFSVCLSDLLKIAFLKKEIHKVSIVIPVSDTDTEKILDSFGFLQEAVLHEEIRCGAVYEDAALFYITSASYKEYNVCFVPFIKGILAVYGGQQFIDRIEFLSYGRKPGGFLATEKALSYSLLDSDGNLLPRGSEAYEFSPEEIDEMPFELGRAFIEFKEYFLKTRYDFDLNLIVNDATDFQMKVWDELKKIPYGSTLSYEDIALRLTDNDIKAARKLSRAVGNACAENPLPIVVPCHRVIGKNGMLMGFSGGIEFKDYLLQNEMFPGVLQLG